MFYLRFTTDRSFNLAAYLVLFVVVGYSIVGGFGFLFLCRPIEAVWDYALPKSCVNIMAWYITCAALNVATDCVILFLPIWLLRPLRVPLPQKLALTLVLMAGGL